MRLRKGAKAAFRNIVPASGVCKQARVPYSRFVTDGRGNMRMRFSIPIDSLGGSCRLGCPDRSEVSSNRGGFEWQFRRISLNWNANTKFSKTNYTKLSCTFQQTTCKLLNYSAGN